ncbi:hypothetical protein [Bacillus thuringiensis]|uniref:hypothetical protein n=1 Tax=Bacillus thuringiensis TaxID=1428 RepID=UPI0037D6AB60
MKRKILTAALVGMPLCIISGNTANAQINTSQGIIPEQSSLQKLSSYQTQESQVVNIDQVVRKAIPGYARFVNGLGETSKVGVHINDVKFLDVEEKYVDPDYPIQSKLIGKGPEKLVQSIEEYIYNEHPSAELTKSHTFQHGISNTSTLTNSVTHNHKAGVKFTYKAKVNLLVKDAEVGGEVAYEYTNSNQTGTSDSKTFTKTFSSTASAKLPPNSKGKLVSSVYTTPATYEIKSRSFFTGSVQFSYVLANDPGTLRTTTVSLHELFSRTDEQTVDDIADNYHMWASTFWNPENGQPVNALLFEGKSILNIDETYHTETRLTDIKGI